MTRQLIHHKDKPPESNISEPTIKQHKKPIPELVCYSIMTIVNKRSSKHKAYSLQVGASVFLDLDLSNSLTSGIDNSTNLHIW